MTMVGGQVGVAVGDGSGVGVSGGGAGVSVGRADVGVGDIGASVGGTGVGVGGTAVSVEQADVGVGGMGVPVDGPGDTVGVGVGHGCAPTGINESNAITSMATVSNMARRRKRIASLSFTSR